MRLAEKTMAGDKEAEADLMLETPTEFMEKMNVKEPKAIAKKTKLLPSEIAANSAVPNCPTITLSITCDFPIITF
mgnify:CR=1 FL=1